MALHTKTRDRAVTEFHEILGTLGIAQHRVAIPLGRLPHLEPGRVVLPGATKESLKSLPEFTFES